MWHDDLSHLSQIKVIFQTHSSLLPPSKEKKIASNKRKEILQYCLSVYMKNIPYFLTVDHHHCLVLELKRVQLTSSDETSELVCFIYIKNDKSEGKD